MITDRDDAFPYNVTAADRQAAKLALSNPDSQPLTVYSDTGPVAPPAPNQPVRIGWGLAALLVVFYLIFMKQRFANWELPITTHPFRLTWPFCIGLAIALIGLAGVWFFLRRDRKRATPKPIEHRFIVTEQGLFFYRPHLRFFYAMRQFDDYRDSGEVLVMTSNKSAALGFILPLRDVPLDRREEFRRHLQKAFEAKPGEKPGDEPAGSPGEKPGGMPQ